MTSYLIMKNGRTVETITADNMADAVQQFAGTSVQLVGVRGFTCAAGAFEIERAKRPDLNRVVRYYTVESQQVRHECRLNDRGHVHHSFNLKPDDSEVTQWGHEWDGLPKLHTVHRVRRDLIRWEWGVRWVSKSRREAAEADLWKQLRRG